MSNSVSMLKCQGMLVTSSDFSLMHYLTTDDFDAYVSYLLFYDTDDMHSTVETVPLNN
jgi:hypothetical protein